jgi:hypothetical protein
MKTHPEAMSQALQTHNQIIRKAKWTFCGHTAEQEGDAFLLVFHSAFDAVCFCLQVRRRRAERRVCFACTVSALTLACVGGLSGCVLALCVL